MSRRRRDCRLLLLKKVVLGQMIMRSRQVTKARVGCKMGRGAPDELEGVGEAFSCSLEPENVNLGKLYVVESFLNSPGFSCLV